MEEGSEVEAERGVVVSVGSALKVRILHLFTYNTHIGWPEHGAVVLHHPRTAVALLALCYCPDAVQS